MKISNSVQPTPVPLDSQPIKPAVHEAAVAAHTPSKPDNEAYNVQLTERAKQIQETATSDEISRDKVAAIRDQLAAGTYSISGKDVANKILGALKG